MHSRSVLTFEGSRIRADALPILRFCLAAPLTCSQVADVRERTKGASYLTLKRMAEDGLLDVHSLPATGRFATRWGALTGYKTSAKGRRVMEWAERTMAALDAGQDPGGDDLDNLPRADAQVTVLQAMRTQPNSVFDLGRVCASA